MSIGKKLGLAFVLIVLGAALYWNITELYFYQGFSTWWLGLVNLLPGVLLLNESRRTRPASLFRKIILVLVIGVLLYLMLGLNMWARCFGSVTRVGAYETVRNQDWHTDWVRHFPRSVPEDARRVRFYYCPPFGQGSMYFQLRFGASEEHIQAEIARVRLLSKRMKHASVVQRREPRLRDESNRGWAPFPSDFRVIALPEYPDPSPGGHGCIRGIAVSNKRSEIVYWAEIW